MRCSAPLRPPSPFSLLVVECSHDDNMGGSVGNGMQGLELAAPSSAFRLGVEECSGAGLRAVVAIISLRHAFKHVNAGLSLEHTPTDASKARWRYSGTRGVWRRGGCSHARFLWHAMCNQLRVAPLCVDTIADKPARRVGYRRGRGLREYVVRLLVCKRSCGCSGPSGGNGCVATCTTRGQRGVTRQQPPSAVAREA